MAKTRHATDHQNGGTDEIDVTGLTGAGSAAHDTSHEDGGADEISIAGLAGESVELAAHKADTTAAHAAAAISFTPNGSIAATDVQAAIQEVRDEAGVGGATLATDTIWDAAGDLAVGTGADTAARLAIGAAGTVLQSNGTTAAWAGAFASWTPALTADTTNPTLGAGSSVAGRYAQIGKLVMGYGEINFGTSGVVAGSGVYEINFPVTSATTIGQKVVGHGYLYDSSAAIFRQVECYQVDSGEFAMVLEGATTVAHNTPWTWAASDILRFQVLYEAA